MAVCNAGFSAIRLSCKLATSVLRRFSLPYIVINMVSWSSERVVFSFLLSCVLRYLLYAIWPLDIQREGTGGQMSGRLEYILV